MEKDMEKQEIEQEEAIKEEAQCGVGDDKEEAVQAHKEAGQEEKDGGKESEAPSDDASGKKKAVQDSKDRLIEELQDKNKRQMAEFVNFRNRTEKEMAARYEIGVRDVVEKILPVVDNFERGFDSISEEERQAPFAAGMDKVFKQLLKMLEDMDVKPVEALGAQFDPNLHNAVMHVEDENAGENVIVEEFQKGYTYRGSVVRHSMVKVAN